MNRPADLKGAKFGRLTVLGRDGSKNGASAWRCLCECGAMRTVRADALRQGRTISCGCLKKLPMNQRGAEGPIEPIYKVTIHQSQKMPGAPKTVRNCFAQIYDQKSDMEIARVGPINFTIGAGSLHPIMSRVMGRMGTKDVRLFSVRKLTSNDHYGIEAEFRQLPDLPPSGQHYADPGLQQIMKEFEND